MTEKMTELFKQLKETYSLKGIPSAIIDKYTEVLYTKLVGALTEVGGSPYMEENCLKDLNPLLAKEKLTEDEVKQKTAIENQMETNKISLTRKHEEIVYYIKMIEEVKLLNA